MHQFAALLFDLKAYILKAALNNCVSVHSITAVHQTQEDHSKETKGESGERSPFIVSDDTAVSDILEVCGASLSRLILIKSTI